MSVARILASKGHGVVTISPSATLQDVVDLLAAELVGAIVVTNREGRLVGIISERDVVRAMARRGGGALDHLVSDHMTRDVVTASVTDPLVEVVKKMNIGRFRHTPIVEGGRLTGLVSSGDATKYHLNEIEEGTFALREYIATACGRLKSTMAQSSWMRSRTQYRALFERSAPIATGRVRASLSVLGFNDQL